MRVKVERLDPMQKTKTIQRRLNFDRRRRPIRFRGRTQPETILDRHPKPSKKRSSERTKLLLRGNGFVAVVQKIRNLALHPLIMRQIGNIANIVVRANKHQMIRMRQKFVNRRDLTIPRRLARTKRVKADDNQRISVVQDPRIQRRQATIVGNTLDLRDRLTCEHLR